jgi:hypothetical protein
MAEAFLSAAAAKSPAVAGTCAELGELYTKKLWHQLTDKLEEVSRNETLHADGFLPQLYSGFVQEIEPKLNALRLAHLAVVVSGHYAERAQSIAFLEATIARLKQAADDGGRGAGSTLSGGLGVGGARAAGLADAVRRASEPALYLQMHVALLTLQGGGIAEAKTMLDAGVATLEGLTDVDPSVHASVHHTACLLHKAKQEFAAFYRSGMLYLAYISVDTLDPITRMVRPPPRSTPITRLGCGCSNSAAIRAVCLRDAQRVYCTAADPPHQAAPAAPWCQSDGALWSSPCGRLCGVWCLVGGEWSTQCGGWASPRVLTYRDARRGVARPASDPL